MLFRNLKRIVHLLPATLLLSGVSLTHGHPVTMGNNVQHSSNQEKDHALARLQKNIHATEKLLERHQEVLQQLLRYKEEMERDGDRLPAEIRDRFLSENKTLIEKQQQEINKTEELLRALFQERDQLRSDPLSSTVTS